MQPLVSVAIVDAQGMAFPTAMHHGQRFVAGERGMRYAVALTNNTADRLEVVVSVDGRDVVSGDRASLSRSRGYVIGPHDTVTIDGFRQSLRSVAAFRFSDVGESYTARRGTPQNAGMIGVAVFKEMRRAPEIARNDATRGRKDKRSAPARDVVPFRPGGPSAGEAGAAPDADPAPAPKTSRSSGRGEGSARMHRPPRTEQELGTEFGETRRSAARSVQFTRQNRSRPDFRQTLRYDSPQALAARGVPIEPLPVAEVVDDLPMWTGETRFAPPPPPGRRRIR
jgi:hypothetical protein